MTRIAIFGKNGCAKCSTTKHKLSHYASKWQVEHQVEVVFHDLETVDGRAEGAFYDVNQIPLTIVEKEGKPVARWEGEVPNSDEVRAALMEEANAAAH